MTNGNDNDDDDSHRDLTRIEDLSEFLHEKDSELEDIFGGFEEKKPADETIGLSLDELDAPFGNDLPPELPEAQEEVQEETLEEPPEEQENFSFESDSTAETEGFDDSPFELSADETEDTSEVPADNSDFIFSAQEDIQKDIQEEQQEEDQTEMEIPQLSQEKFEEVRNFAQNFSYGQIQGGGNPPFSIIIRNLKYASDAEDIITILREFGLVTDQNLQETEKALSFGSLLIPQISEYSAIVIAHKLRRYDCDLEVGLSDEIHPSKSGESNPRGLMKKDSLRQNKKESFKKSEDDTPAKEIIVSTTATLAGHVIKKYIGVQTSFAIVDEEELERLKFVQKTVRMQSVLHNYETDESVTSERAFKDYQNSFELLFTDLCDQLKARAMKERANALLGLNYQLTSLPFEKSALGGSCYQLTCSATLAVVLAE